MLYSFCLMTALTTPNPIWKFYNDVQHTVYDLHQKAFGSFTTDHKVFTIFVIGRVLQTAALASIVAAVGFSFVAGPIVLTGIIPAVALGVIGSLVAQNPDEINDNLQLMKPFVIGQPIGLRNQGNDCWLNSSLQLLVNSPAFHGRMRQFPELSRFLDTYAGAESGLSKVASIDTHALRQDLSRLSGGHISSGATQEDAAQFFEFLFEGLNAPFVFDQRTNGGLPIVRREPMISVSLDGNPLPSFQQLFNNYFNYQDDLSRNLRLTLARPPEDLIVQAKRFYQYRETSSSASATAPVIRDGKINDDLDISERLTLSGQCVRNNQSANYDCDAFTIHNGTSQHGGHYTCYVKRQNVWWYCSDSTVYEVSASEALAAMKRGYIFHYKKI